MKLIQKSGRFCSFLMFLACFSNLKAHAEDELKGKESHKPPAYIDVKTGYFFFADLPMRNLYKEGGIDVQISGAYPLIPYLNIYGSVEYLEKSGRSRNGNERTSIWEVPLSIGLQPNFLISSKLDLRYYFTLGPRYIFAYVHNCSHYVPRHMHSKGLGLFVNTGFIFNVYHGLTIDIFGEYSYKRLRFSSHKPFTQGHTVNVGGALLGLGIGYSF